MQTNRKCISSVLWGNNQDSGGFVARDKAGKRQAPCCEGPDVTHMLSINFELYPKILIIATVLANVLRLHYMPLYMK